MNETQITYCHNDEVSNRILTFKNNETEHLIVFVAGWSSTPSTWRYFLPVLQEKATVHYFETREKAHTKYVLTSPSFDINAMSNDLVFYLNNLKKDYVLIGASVGASVIINSFNQLLNTPLCVVLLTPNSKIKIQSSLQVLRITPVKILRFVRPLILTLINVFSFKADAHRIEGLVNAMNSAELATSKKSIIQLSSMNLLAKKPERLNIPALIIATNKDSVHNSHDSILFQERLGADLIRFETFTEAHSSRCAKQVIEWTNSKGVLS